MRIYESPEERETGFSACLFKELEYPFHDESVKIEVCKGLRHKYGQNPPIMILRIKSKKSLDFEVVVDNEVLISEINECLEKIDDIESKKRIFDIAVSFLKGEYVLHLMKQVHDNAWKEGRNELRKQLGNLLDDE